MKSCKSKAKSKKVCLMQERVKTLSTRFSYAEIDLQEYSQGLSIFVAKDVKENLLFYVPFPFVPVYLNSKIAIHSCIFFLALKLQY